MMLESNLKAGNQKNTGDLATMQYGVSITDACIDWETTEQLIVSAHEQVGRIGDVEADGYSYRYKVR
jgi:3-deoxy-7-phosphoheptulonate synthase